MSDVLTVVTFVTFLSLAGSALTFLVIGVGAVSVFPVSGVPEGGMFGAS